MPSLPASLSRARLTRPAIYIDRQSDAPTWIAPVGPCQQARSYDGRIVSVIADYPAGAPMIRGGEVLLCYGKRTDPSYAIVVYQGARAFTTGDRVSGSGYYVDGVTYLDSSSIVAE